MKFLRIRLTKNKINFLVFIIFFILPFIFFKNGFQIFSYILGSGDAFNIAIPIQEFIEKLIKSGQFPFWNHYNFSGYPILGYIEASIFYPITLFLNLIFPTVLSYNLSIILHYSLAGIFMYLFLQEYSLNYYASFTGGLIFMFSGSVVSQRSHPWQLYTMIWIPLVLLLLEKFRKTKRIEYILIASLFYAISFFAGSPQIFLYSSIVILFYILFYSLIFEGVKNYYFLLSFLIFIFGALIASIQIFSSIELTKNSLRDYISYEYFSGYSYSPKSLVLLFFPYIFGNPYDYLFGTSDYFGPSNYTETVIYFGIFTVIPLTYGFFIKNKHKYLWIFIMIFFIYLSVGQQYTIL